MVMSDLLSQEQLSALFREIQDRDMRELRKINDALRELVSKSSTQVAEEKAAVDLSNAHHQEKYGRDTEEGGRSQS